MIRKIVQIDEAKCNGCGICVPSCAEGAITIVDGKARLAADNLCDGLGACLGECPLDAIRVIERDADEFDENAVERHLSGGRHESVVTANSNVGQGHSESGGCSGSRLMSLSPAPREFALAEKEKEPSLLGQWPVQLHLVPTNAPFLQNADLLIAADCVPFAYAGFHRDFLAGKALLIGCPKLDDNRFYQDKLTEMFRTSSIRSITVLRMEVPCCGGIVLAAKQALSASGKQIPFTEITIGVHGEIPDKK